MKLSSEKDAGTVGVDHLDVSNGAGETLPDISGLATARGLNTRPGTIVRFSPAVLTKAASSREEDNRDIVCPMRERRVDVVPERETAGVRTTVAELGPSQSPA